MGGSCSSRSKNACLISRSGIVSTTQEPTDVCCSKTRSTLDLVFGGGCARDLLIYMRECHETVAKTLVVKEPESSLSNNVGGFAYGCFWHGSVLR